MDLIAVMLVGAAVGASGRFLFEGPRVPGDGVIATMLGILGAMVTAFMARGAALTPAGWSMVLVSALGAMAFFLLFRVAVGDLRGRPPASGGGVA